MKPEHHQAYLAFMSVWDAPADMSLRYQDALDKSERQIVEAALVFAKSDAPPAVREALVAWLRPRMAGGGSWNPAASALRMLCDTEEERSAP